MSGNAYQSAVKAGYSEKYAKAQSSQLLENVGISEYIQNRMEELQDEKILTQKQILVMLSEIASGQAEEANVFMTKKPVMLENPETGKFVKGYEDVPEIVMTPTKNSDRNKALELLGKRYRMWTDKVDVDANVSTNKLDAILEQLEGPHE
ncbi:terminase small subunit [Streptococcus rupicaprae]|uniref:terminase small subunit n=1 Tax=Streptococcus rupicaprae TaxID=759619 RepID=UPI0033968D2C